MSASPIAPSTARARQYQNLVKLAALCRTTIGELDHPRAQQLLLTTAAHCDAVTAIFDAQPDLHEWIEHLPYERPFSIIAELLKQTHWQIRSVASDELAGRAHPRGISNSDRWEEVEALAERSDFLVNLAVSRPPELHLDDPKWCQTLSAQLVSRRLLAEAAQAIEDAITTARRVPHVAPNVKDLAKLASNLRRSSEPIDAIALHDDWWTSIFAIQHTTDQSQ